MTKHPRGVYSERGHATHVRQIQREAQARAMAYAREQLAEQDESLTVVEALIAVSLPLACAAICYIAGALL